MQKHKLIWGTTPQLHSPLLTEFSGYSLAGQGAGAGMVEEMQKSQTWKDLQVVQVQGEPGVCGGCCSILKHH